MPKLLPMNYFYLLYLVIMAMLFGNSSCNTSPTAFEGFTGLELGKDLKSLTHFEKFHRTMPDEYYISEYAIPGGVGSISHLNVSAKDKKISEVKFATNSKTNVKLLLNSLDDLKELLPALGKNLKLRVFMSPDQNTLLAIEEKTKALKGGIIFYEYTYQTAEAFRSKHPLSKPRSNK